MNNRKKLAAGVAGLGVAVGVTLAGMGVVGAAHGGALTDGQFSGRAEVAADATNHRIVGDPDGRGEAYVFSTGGGVVCHVVEVDKIAPATAVCPTAPGRRDPLDPRDACRRGRSGHVEDWRREVPERT